MGCGIHAAKRIVPTRRQTGRQGTTIEDCHKGRQDVRDDDISEMTRPISDLVTRSAVSIDVAATIQDAARHMHANDVSCVLIVDDTTIRGIVTDRDIRNRAAADGRPVSDAALSIASEHPITVDATATIFEVMLLMTRKRIHHLPVMRDGQVIGVITATSLMRSQYTSPVSLGNSIHRQTDLQGLVNATAQTAALQKNLASADASAYNIGHIMTAITDATTNQLLVLAHQALGPAPIPYAWAAAGSQGRSEQTAKTDQDNCLILDDAFEASRHGEYFEKLANFVCNGLNACGYVYCPGNMMASNPQWRVTLQQWKKYFERWITQPDSKALMLTCVFFDLRFIGGDAQLMEQLQKTVFPMAKKNGIFLSYMAANALSHRPALSWWGGLSWSQAKKHPKSINLKHQAIVPIVDLARVYALSEGVVLSNTHDRLAAANHNIPASASSAHDLRDTLAYLGKIRIQHQATQTSAGEKADNYLRQKSLSRFETIRIQHAFKTITQLQAALAHRYQTRNLT